MNIKKRNYLRKFLKMQSSNAWAERSKILVIKGMKRKRISEGVALL